MTAGLNSRPKEWSRSPEPHPPTRDVGAAATAATVCELDLVCAAAIRSWKRAQTLDSKQRPENCPPLNLPLDCKHAHVSGHLMYQGKTRYTAFFSRCCR